MSSTLIRNSIRIARKRHMCMASDWLCQYEDGFDGFTFAEKRAIVLARRNGWFIQPGEAYVSQACTIDGFVYSFKAIKAIHDICIKYKLYDYDL
jgi:hypothetical protein